VGQLVTGHWVLWNLLLALVPLAIAARVFVAPPRQPHSAWWWIGLIAFVALLPNSPYVVTDLVHLQESLGHDTTVIVLLRYAVLVVGGVLAYVVSIRLLHQWLRNAGLPSWPIEVALHALCTVGIALGRLFRFNSWDLLLRPTSVVEAVGVPTRAHAVVLGAIFVALCASSVLVRGLAGIRVARPLAD
jgi:uncharacterized membrane protein